SMLHIHSFFFFFQAEDGIRVFHVTGVQTCALPISAGVKCTTAGCSPSNRNRSFPSFSGRSLCGLHERRQWPAWRASPHRHTTDRSEERRVGKDGESRWSLSKYEDQPTE